QLRMIWNLWVRWRMKENRRRSLDDLGALNGFLESRFGLSHARFLSRVTAGRVIEALKDMAGRKA
ncbi:MAG: phage protein GemA/Gp16 family protein, partial [Thermodesulfobacteriota bacterium]